MGRTRTLINQNKRPVGSQTKMKVHMLLLKIFLLFFQKKQIPIYFCFFYCCSKLSISPDRTKWGLPPDLRTKMNKVLYVLSTLEFSRCCKTSRRNFSSCYNQRMKTIVLHLLFFLNLVVHKRWKTLGQTLLSYPTSS